MPPHDQHGADVRFEWGQQGLAALLSGGVQTVVLIDVLRFTTAVDVACGRGAAITAFSGEGDASAVAARRGALLAAGGLSGGDTSSPSLSPVSLRNLRPDDHVLLPSSLVAPLAEQAVAAGVVVLAGCLRNPTALAETVTDLPVGVVAVGEQWPDGSLRVAIEDAWGAGALIRALSPPASADPTIGLLAMFGGEGLAAAPPQTTRAPSLSPEAAWVAANLPADLPKLLPRTASGRQLQDAGWSLDIEVAAALDVSRTVPRLDKHGTFRSA